MNLSEITSLVVSANSTLNTIETSDSIQHTFGFRSCIGSIQIQCSKFIDTEGNLSVEGIYSLSNYCDILFDILNATPENLNPFLDGIKDAVMCAQSIIKENCI
jgi:hypothetical protein